MIEFDASKLSYQIVRLKRITSAAGGSAMIMIDMNSDDEGKDNLRRIDVPFSVARAFIKAHEQSKFLVAVPVCLVMYENIVAAIEIHPFGTLTLDELDDWVPISSRVVASVIDAIAASDKKWYVDGRYIYHFSHDTLKESVLGGTSLESKQHFRSVSVQALDMHEFTSPKVSIAERSCIAYITDTMQYSISPPIWRGLALGRSSHNNILVSDEDEDSSSRNDGSTTGNVLTNLDTIDERVFVNLNFVLRCGKIVGKHFGFEVVERLKLPQIMLDVGKINLPGLPTGVKTTYDTGNKLTHIMAWLLGLMRDVQDLQVLIDMRAVLKHLTTKGIYRRNSLNTIIQPGQELGSVERVDISDVLNYIKQ